MGLRVIFFWDVSPNVASIVTWKSETSYLLISPTASSLTSGVDFRDSYGVLGGKERYEFAL